MPGSFTEARKRQMARLQGAKPPTARAAMALAKSQAYQDAADSSATLRAYAADLANFEAWCGKHGFQAMPATPEVVGAYLAAAGEGYAMPTLRRRVAVIARACGVAGHLSVRLCRCQANSRVRPPRACGDQLHDAPREGRELLCDVLSKQRVPTFNYRPAALAAAST